MKRHRVDGPAVLIDDPRLLTMLWPVIRRCADNLRDRGATAALRRLEPLEAAWSHAVEATSASGPPDTEGDPEPAQSGRDGHRVSSAEAAGLLGITPRQVRRLASTGRLDAERVGRQWIVDRDSIAAYQQERRA